MYKSRPRPIWNILAFPLHTRCFFCLSSFNAMNQSKTMGDWPGELGCWKLHCTAIISAPLHLQCTAHATSYNWHCLILSIKTFAVSSQMNQWKQWVIGWLCWAALKVSSSPPHQRFTWKMSPLKWISENNGWSGEPAPLLKTPPHSELLTVFYCILLHFVNLHWIALRQN